VRAARWLVPTLIASALAATAGCGSPGADKAGGGEAGARPLALTLVEHDPSYGGAQYAQAVERLSGGTIRVHVISDWENQWVDGERRTIADVQAGRAKLAVVGARVWDTIGVDSFDALLAPFLVDTLDAERRVASSPIAATMLSGVGRAGVVGLALLPGALRRPFGYRRALVGRADYVGARMGVKPGRVEEETLRTLGATTRNYNTLSGASRDGAVPDLSTIASLGWRGRTLAANVVFWPRAETVVMNRRAYAGLTGAQRAVLRSAGRAALGPRLREIDRVEGKALGAICERGLARLVTASPEQLAALRAAVRPVYRQLERNRATRRFLVQISDMPGAGAAVQPLGCGARSSTVTPALEGVWSSTVSRRELLSQGASAAEAAAYQGPARLQLKAGRWIFHGDHTTVTGRYRIEGDTVRMTMVTCTVNPCSPGAVTEYTWSVYRNSLTLARNPAGTFWPRLVAAPSTRVG
jgi:TRAP-type C4-dicarboxylate transport system substrate-binding protein